jgi:hypothetical protein
MENIIINYYGKEIIFKNKNEFVNLNGEKVKCLITYNEFLAMYHFKIFNYKDFKKLHPDAIGIYFESSIVITTNRRLKILEKIENVEILPIGR